MNKKQKRRRRAERRAAQKYWRESWKDWDARSAERSQARRSRVRELTTHEPKVLKEIFYFVSAPVIVLVILVASLFVFLYRLIMPTRWTPVGLLPAHRLPNEYKWESYPALQAFMNWHSRWALDRMEDEAMGVKPPTCFAVAARRISKTIRGHLNGELVDDPIEKGELVRVCKASAMGDLLISKVGAPRPGSSVGVLAYTQRVDENCCALVDFRESLEDFRSESQ